MTVKPHPLCLLAVEELQEYLRTQQQWVHNFGLDDRQEGNIIGKMFGVLVVETPQKKIEYLWAFSGKLADRNLFIRFVPPVFDTLCQNSFLSAGMKRLSEMGLKIENLKEQQFDGYEKQVQSLQKERRKFSVALQHRLFESYHFLNQEGDEKSLIQLFKEAGYKNPPAGAGECAAPKLLQYAFQHQLRPLALTEFWWGKSPKSATWKHGHFYAPCKEKCEPILSHMLKGINGI
ncbi:hypothetical protein WG904_00730 [Pedobacter sp. Du54]|uniref:hypothetical protein n=1 Tax=Pedobacter anseongensis TaxID=3133439 RepID=UPI0030AEC55B